MKRLLYAGSFDPVTLGHMDIITRASRLCEELLVAVMFNPDKQGNIPVPVRVELLRRACAGLPNVRVISHDGLLIRCAEENGITAVVRGVRPIGDFESEFQMAQINRMLGGVETMFIPASEGVGGISSSIVRQIAFFGGDIHSLVPEGLAQEIMEALRV